MHLAFTPLAEQDLEGIADYIAADNSARALSFVRELRTQCQRITLNPAGYRQRPELGDGIRSCAHGRYVIFFEATREEVLVIRILHGARDLPAVLRAKERSQLYTALTTTDWRATDWCCCCAAATSARRMRT